MDFTVVDFTNQLLTLIHTSKYFPYMEGDYVDINGRIQSDSKKHPKRTPTHLKDVVGSEMKNTLIFGVDNGKFDLGSELLERVYPYYHILQDAPVIRKAYRGTTKSKGSQQYERNVGKRDYGRVDWNGKTFTKEYSRNVRGSRVNLSRTTMRFGDTSTSRGNWYQGTTNVNSSANQYLNIHYKYLDRICDDIAPKLAEMFGLKLMRKQDSGLIDEFADQEGLTIEQVLDIFGSFMEE